MRLGDRVRDIITGFEGIVVAETNWLYGCRRLTVQPEAIDKDGDVVKTGTFDEPQLTLVAAGVHQAQLDKPAVYGPRDDKAALRR